MQTFQQLQCQNNPCLIDLGELKSPLQHLNSWQLSSDKQRLYKTFNFKDYYQTTAFINAATYIAHQQDHHPNIHFSYQRCTIEYSTHSAGGLTMNDFICAARIDNLNI